MKSKCSTLTPRRIADYCDRRLSPLLTLEEVRSLRDCLTDLLERKEYPPYRGGGLDLKILADQLGMDASRLAHVRNSLQPIFDAVARAVAEYRLRPEPKPRPKRAPAAEPAGADKKVVAALPLSLPVRKGKRPPRQFGRSCYFGSAHHLRMAFEVSSVPFSLMIIPGFPQRSIGAASSRATPRPEIDVSGIAEKHLGKLAVPGS